VFRNLEVEKEGEAEKVPREAGTSGKGEEALLSRSEGPQKKKHDCWEEDKSERR